ncbi:MAG TPA: hypothetical protein VEF71_08675, partial [Streptosporangiaceae bacterium]|nr:hypothetical protein [Streptosporangiaceae bacterium]
RGSGIAAGCGAGRPERVSGAAGPGWCCVALAGRMPGHSGLGLDTIAELSGGKAAGLRICG